jgi:hypothetical protein
VAILSTHLLDDFFPEEKMDLKRQAVRISNGIARALKQYLKPGTNVTALIQSKIWKDKTSHVSSSYH